MASKMSIVLDRVSAKAYSLHRELAEQVEQGNLKAAKAFMKEPDIQSALPVIKLLSLTFYRDDEAIIRQIVSRPGKELIARLVSHGYIEIINHVDWFSTQNFVLLSTALSTTKKKIWTDIHSPLKSFLNDVESSKDMAALDAVIDNFLKALE